MLLSLPVWVDGSWWSSVKFTSSCNLRVPVSCFYNENFHCCTGYIAPVNDSVEMQVYIARNFYFELEDMCVKIKLTTLTPIPGKLWRLGWFGCVADAILDLYHLTVISYITSITLKLMNQRWTCMNFMDLKTMTPIFTYPQKVINLDPLWTHTSQKVLNCVLARFGHMTRFPLYGINTRRYLKDFLKTNPCNTITNARRLYLLWDILALDP